MHCADMQRVEEDLRNMRALAAEKKQKKLEEKMEQKKKAEEEKQKKLEVGWSLRNFLNLSHDCLLYILGRWSTLYLQK